MGPIVKELASTYADKSIQFVTFDFTSDETKAAAKSKAEALGVMGTFEKNAPNTGFGLIYNTKTQKVVAKMTAGDETSEWDKVIAANIGG